jgi:hypothetical protein
MRLVARTVRLFGSGFAGLGAPEAAGRNFRITKFRALHSLRTPNALLPIGKQAL